MYYHNTEQLNAAAVRFAQRHEIDLTAQYPGWAPMSAVDCEVEVSATDGREDVRERGRRLRALWARIVKRIESN